MKTIKIAIILLGLFINLLPFFAFAQEPWWPLVPCGTTQNPNPCTIACFLEMIDRIISFLLYGISIPLAVTGFIAAGIHLIFGSSEQTVAKGKAILKFTLLGLVLAFASFLIVDAILKELLKNPSWGGFIGSC